MKIDETVSRTRAPLTVARLAGAIIALAWTGVATAQSGALSAPPTGGRDLVAMTFAGTPIGSFPSGLEKVDGAMEVVMKDGQPMLRATTRSTFRVNLPEVLPQDFTLEFDLVPKTCCQPEDIAFEGTATINQGNASANVQWHHEHQMVVGGGPTHSSKVPDDIAVALPGVLTNVVFAMQGDQMTMFTNGRRLYTIQRKFARSRVLRVFLGGQNDAERAVYLARLRVAAWSSGAVAGSNSVPASTTSTSPPTAVLTQPTTTATGMTVSGSGTNPSATTGTATTTGATGMPSTGGTVVGSAPVTRPAPTPMPAPFNTSSTLTNITPPSQPPATNSQASTGSSGAPVAGPAATALVWAGNYSPTLFGLLIVWTKVPNAVTYRVYRGEVGKIAPVSVHLTIPATDAETAGDIVSSGSGLATLLDADIPPGFGTPVYWVDATFADGSISALSPNATFSTSTVNPAAAWASLGAPGPQNLQAIVGPLTTVLPSGGNGIPGRNVTWSWDPAPWVLYQIDVYAQVSATGMLGPSLLYSETILPSSLPLFPEQSTPLPILSPYASRGYPVGPPVTRGVPSGSMVQICVAAARRSATQPLTVGPYTSCLATQIP